MALTFACMRHTMTACCMSKANSAIFAKNCAGLCVLGSTVSTFIMSNSPIIFPVGVDRGQADVYSNVFPGSRIGVSPMTPGPLQCVQQLNMVCIVLLYCFICSTRNQVSTLCIADTAAEQSL